MRWEAGQAGMLLEQGLEAHILIHNQEAERANWECHGLRKPFSPPPVTLAPRRPHFNPSKTVPPTRDRVYKHMSLWGPLHSNHHTYCLINIYQICITMSGWHREQWSTKEQPPISKLHETQKILGTHTKRRNTCHREKLRKGRDGGSHP